MRGWLMGFIAVGCVLSIHHPGRCNDKPTYTDRFNVDEEVEYVLEKVSRRGREVTLSIAATFTKGARDREFLYFRVNMVDVDGNPHQSLINASGNRPVPERITLRRGIKTNLNLRFLLDPKVTKLQILEVTMSGVERAAIKFEDLDLAKPATKTGEPKRIEPLPQAEHVSEVANPIPQTYVDRLNVDEEVEYVLEKVSHKGREVTLIIAATFTKGARDRQFQYYRVNMVDVDGAPHQSLINASGNRPTPEGITLRLGIKTNLNIRFLLDPRVTKLQTLEVTMSVLERVAMKFTDLDLSGGSQADSMASASKADVNKSLGQVARVMIQLIKEAGSSVDQLEDQVYAQGGAAAFPSIAEEFASRLTSGSVGNMAGSRQRLEAALVGSPEARKLWHAELAKLELRPGKRDVMQAMIKALEQVDPNAAGRYSGTNELSLHLVINDYAKAEKAGQLKDTQEVEKMIAGKLIVESQLEAARQLLEK